VGLHRPADRPERRCRRDSRRPRREVAPRQRLQRRDRAGLEQSTPISWNYYDQTGGADYNLQEPSVVVEFDQEPRLRWVKSLHTELCTSRWAYVWQRHWRQPGGGSYHSGSFSAEDALFEFKNPDGNVRWTVSVTRAC